jgi:hypothetical protein
MAVYGSLHDRDLLAGLGLVPAVPVDAGPSGRFIEAPVDMVRVYRTVSRMRLLS